MATHSFNNISVRSKAIFLIFLCVARLTRLSVRSKADETFVIVETLTCYAKLFFTVFVPLRLLIHSM